MSLQCSFYSEGEFVQELKVFGQILGGWCLFDMVV